MIAFARENRTPALIDDGLARAAAAEEQVAVVGSLGVLRMAKQRGYVDRVAPLVAALRDSGIYFGDPLIERYLYEMNESWVVSAGNPGFVRNPAPLKIGGKLDFEVRYPRFRAFAGAAPLKPCGHGLFRANSR